MQIHHIDEDPSNNSLENLAVVCLEHHNDATAPGGLTARLKPADIFRYKLQWEAECQSYATRIARSRASFFMVDYKNVDRIRQLYAQLNATERGRACDLLREQFAEEQTLRGEQGFDYSSEPTTTWNPTVEGFVELLRSGSVHPPMFENCRSHPQDPLLPVGFDGSPPSFFLYDIWCQVMVRAILACRSALPIEDLAGLDDPRSFRLEGALLSFQGELRGNVAIPGDWSKKPLSRTRLTVKVGPDTWTSILELKTHYVYSTTASIPLSKGKENGIVVFRSTDSVSNKKKKGRTVHSSCTPLIVGSGVLNIP